jgi:(R)-amidase
MMKIKLAQLEIKDGTVDENLNKVLADIDETEGSVDLIVFPETSLCGFPMAIELSSVAITVDSEPIQRIKSAAKNKRVGVAFGFAELDDSTVYNTAALIDKSGKLILKYRKTHLWPHSDLEVFSPGNTYATCLFEGMRVGLLICYDIEFPETARALARLDAEVIIVLDGNMDPYGPVHRRAIVARAMENQCFAVLVNRIGDGRSLKFPGESVAVDPFGEIITEILAEQENSVVELKISLLKQSRVSYNYLGDVRSFPSKLPKNPNVDDSEVYESVITEQ